MAGVNNRPFLPIEYIDRARRKEFLLEHPYVYLVKMAPSKSPGKPPEKPERVSSLEQSLQSLAAESSSLPSAEDSNGYSKLSRTSATAVSTKRLSMAREQFHRQFWQKSPVISPYKERN